MNHKTKRMVLMGMFIALSLVGSYIKIPGPFQSIALDSMPAFLAGLVLGGPQGAVVGFLGHMLTAANAGFYLTLPIHLLVGFMMAVTVYIFVMAYERTNRMIGAIVGITLNGVGAPLLLALLPQFGWGFFTGIVSFLLLASAANVIMGILVFVSLQRSGFKGFDALAK